jgi:hypothetical protein
MLMLNSAMSETRVAKIGSGPVVTAGVVNATLPAVAIAPGGSS